jgi:predicted AlkP superfamily phosphohydrolase/phosphomutase
MTPKTLLVGWDSASWDYLDPLLEKGELLNLQGLVDAGCRGTLRSTIPPITPAAWSSIITGKLPQKHGVYDWVWDSADRLRFATSSDRIGTPFWQRLNAEGIRVGLVNIPITFPPTPLDGFIVCGFGAPDPPAALSYPEVLLAEIERQFGPYTPAVSPERAHELRRGRGQYAAYEEELRVQETHVQIALHLADRYPVDVLAINLMLFDHMNHRALDMTLVEASLQEMDRQLGLLLEGFGPDDILLLSDHGARRIEGLFLLADWLSDRGYLVRRRKAHQTTSELNYLLRQYLNQGWGLRGRDERVLRALLRGSLDHLPDALVRAFWRSVQVRVPRAFDHYCFEEEVDIKASPVLKPRNIGAIYVNRHAGLPGRHATPEQTAEGLARELAQVRIPRIDRPLFQNVFNRAELYGVGAPGEPPDLILDYYGSDFSLHTNKAVSLKQREPYFAFLGDNPKADLWHGDHHPDGVYLFSGSSFDARRPVGRAHLVDIPATLLHLYEVPLPDDFDGKALTSVFLEDCPVLSQPGDAAPPGGYQESEYSESEADQVLSHLRALGYVD